MNSRLIAVRSDSEKDHILILNKGKNSPNIFIIPGIGGICEVYQELATQFGDNYNVYGLQMYGVFPGEIPLKTISEIAGQNIKWIKTIQSEGPYIIMGHSFGAHIAFEMTRQLEAKGDEIKCVAVLDTDASLKSILSLGVSELNMAIKLIKGYLESFGLLKDPYPAWTSELVTKLSQLPLHEMGQLLFDYLPDKIRGDDENLFFALRLIRLRLTNDTFEYRPEGKINSLLILFKAEHEGAINIAEENNWGNYTSQFQSITIPGNHDMYNNENSKVIAEFLKNNLIL